MTKIKVKLGYFNRIIKRMKNVLVKITVATASVVEAVGASIVAAMVISISTYR